MCTGFLPVLSLAASVGQGIMGYMGEQAQYEADKVTYKTNLDNAIKSSNDRYESINNRVVQENATATQQMEEASIEGLKARASARTAAAEGGVSGVSVNSIVNDMFSREATFAANTKTNFDYSRNYWIGEGKAARAQGQNQINAVPKPRKPSFLPTAVSMFGSAVKALG
jgi:hypothetical protein